MTDVLAYPSKRIAVVSSVYGDYDEINIPVDQSVPCEFIMVTDSETEPDKWQVVYEPKPESVGGRLASRIAKCDPWLYTDADIVIWVDADIKITSPDFVKWCVESLGDDVICQWKQTEATINRELRVSRQFRKWDGDPLEAQVAYYKSRGYPEERNTYWCGIMVRSRDCPKFGLEWLHEMVRWSCQDQIAYGFITWKYGLEPALLPMADLTPMHVNNRVVGWQYEHYIRWRHSEVR